MFYADASVIEIVAHLMIAYLFIITGIHNIPKLERLSAQMAKNHVPFPKAAMIIGYVWQFVGGGMILDDWHADIGAGLLVVFTITATLLFHRFWEEKDDPVKRMYHGWYFNNNFAVVGGLLLLVAGAP